MNRNKLIKTLVSEFKEQICNLPDEKLEGLESGKLEISITQAVGNEAGGAAPTARRMLGKEIPAPARPSPHAEAPTFGGKLKRRV
ncbi:hypothetical protein [Legionella micdadei]|uniref:Uncharacterized protein n=1 Tax=Legionella micdadei TaxID=451 RepID=A0A098GD44_LEGMI|nr:hypothetical protein [Legionella micdadei]ARG97974.1 hypothetical protein B6N58_10060 [Legionella micdadei]ARG99708.1 hypothetical protein B6V88_04355 [Legionella micdadei]KTD30229.1 hypothetical protein Lmic_0184 [Legionella micdadei]NSL19229.1 hypothetical protein [Legionella micdadei]CEG60404.1 protein of unknown function [Legionella micdadei]